MMNSDHSSSRETCVRRERSKIEVTNVSTTGGYSTDGASSSGVEAFAANGDHLNVAN